MKSKKVTFEVLDKHKPNFNIGDEAWVILSRNGKRTENVTKIYILGINFTLALESSCRPVLVCTGYQTDRFNPDVPNFSSTTFPPYEVYCDEKTASELATWRPVEGISYTMWKKAIGKSNRTDLEFCELTACCDIASRILDFLFLCKKQGGLIERDVRKLLDLFLSHGYPQKSTNLDKILQKLGIFEKIKSTVD